MTHMSSELPTSGRPTAKLTLLTLLRAALSVGALGAAYVLIPIRRGGEGSEWPWLVLELGVFAIIVALQVPAIAKARYPILRAVETLAILIPVFLLIFARIYLAASQGHASAFNQHLTTVSALYFTVTVFASVGFGDIVARSEGMQLLVTLQMLLNLAVFGVVIRLLVYAARRGVARRDGKSGVGDRPG